MGPGRAEGKPAWPATGYRAMALIPAVRPSSVIGTIRPGAIRVLTMPIERVSPHCACGSGLIHRCASHWVNARASQVASLSAFRYAVAPPGWVIS